MITKPCIVLSFLFVSLMGISFLFAQNPGSTNKDSVEQTTTDGAYKKIDPFNRRYTPYPPLREADVMWSRRIWRYIDLTEKINHPMAYPKSSQAIKDRQNLFDIIHNAALTSPYEEGSLIAYRAYKGVFEDDEFTEVLSVDEVKQVGGSPPDTIGYEDPETGKWIEKVITNELDRDAVIKFKIKEDWFFEKQKSVMDVRIIGIAPVIELYSETGEFLSYNMLYWVYFPELRTILKNQQVFNTFNQAKRLTYDDLFMKRRFSSYIIKESNVFNRRIKDYAVGLDALLESNRIRDEIFLYEHDMWEY